jgi:hypothetical protein
MRNADQEAISQWFQFTDGESSWVDEAEVTAAHLLDRFWNHVGHPREQFSSGEILSTQEFISEYPLFEIEEMY